MLLSVVPSTNSKRNVSKNFELHAQDIITIIGSIVNVSVEGFPHDPIMSMRKSSF